MQLIEHYFPKTIENRIKAIYYDTSPEVQMMMTADERDKHLEGLADWYIVNLTRRYEQFQETSFSEDNLVAEKKRAEYMMTLKIMSKLREKKKTKMFKYVEYKNIPSAQMALLEYEKRSTIMVRNTVPFHYNLFITLF
jgi:hypothetical protein